MRRILTKQLKFKFRQGAGLTNEIIELKRTLAVR